ncbi:uncharacterized protein E0L32_007684 [Thyridium curvatum]|uniref:Uncharacterized protein n=1 Tax=Thyridium curvatum TaxID=1093900 RepID=A0A507AM20_9PEZI|nr:uncharacterized protein E0L32_007684 [Thyridium curvatum]TPX11705.1 hypothetical protein E0L32_007684 [Thyridium curvatum]
MAPITISAQIDILASPALVRQVFMDFAGYSQWQQGWNIRPVESGKNPLDLQASDRLRVSMHGMTFHPSVVDNRPEHFIWDGSLYGLFTGRHTFDFAHNKNDPSTTTFVQREEFWGPLTYLFRPFIRKDQPMENWATFNEALKKECERRSHQA